MSDNIRMPYIRGHENKCDRSEELQQRSMKCSEVKSRTGWLEDETRSSDESKRGKIRGSRMRRRAQN